MTTVAAAETTEEQGNMRSNTADSLPDDLNFEGQTVRVLARGGDADTETEFFAEEQSADIVSEAVYKRNLAVEERLNVDTELILTNSTRHAGDADTIRNSVTSGSDDYDLVANHMHYTMPLALDNIFYNLITMPYIDFSQPWWNKSYTDLVNINE